MANKQINELTGKTSMLNDNDLILIYDSEEAGSEKTKKVAISDYTSIINSAITVYVATTGNDTTGDGTSGNPWATPNKAWDWACTKIFGNLSTSITIKINDGTYNSLEAIYSYNPSGQQIHFEGNTSTPANVVLNFASGQDGFRARNGGQMFLNGLKIVGGGSQANKGVYSETGSCVQVYNSISTNWSVGAGAATGAFIHLNASTFNNNISGISTLSLARCFVSGCTSTSNTNGAYASRASIIYIYSSSITGNSVNTGSNLNGVVYTE